jgi:hypothetical protein
MNNKLKYGVGIFIAVLIITTGRVIIKPYLDNTPSPNPSIRSVSLNPEKPWITWVYSGIKITTPEKLNDNVYKMSEYEKSVTAKIGSYLFNSKEIYIMVHYLKYLKSEVGYDFESGLKVAIGNGVNALNGTNLTFSIANTSDDNKKIGAGTFQLGREIMEYKEIMYFNGKNEIGAVIIVGPQSDYTNKLITKIISSVEYLF